MLACTIGTAVGCDEEKPPPPERTEPWPAPAVGADRPDRRVVSYRIEPRSGSTVDVSTRRQKNEGVLPVARGNLDVDLLDLAKTRGEVALDVAAMRMQSFEDEPEQNQEQTRRARAWLDLGASRPEPHREKHRWATFRIRSIVDPSVDAAHRGKVVKQVPADDAGPEAGPPPGETRVVDLTAVGDLTFHGVRVEAGAKLTAEFHYADGASFDTTPDAILVRSRAPIVVSLAAHDVKPRDEKGVALAEEQRMIGREVARDARVRVEVRAVPAR